MGDGMNAARILLLGALFALAMPVQGAILVRNGHVLNSKYAPVKPADEHFNDGMEAYNSKDWKEAIKQFHVVADNFPRTPLGNEAQFFLAESYYYRKDYEFANKHADKYLKQQDNHKRFEQAIVLKFAVAEKYRQGSYRRLFGFEQLPKIVPAWDTAIDIYDDIIMALPSHDVAARAMYCKGRLLVAMKEYREAIDTWQTLVRQFPKHEFAPDAFARISRTYVIQAKVEPQNPDTLALAEVNAHKFAQQFPGEERLSQVDKDLAKICETVAEGLYETGRFYERTKKPEASVVYYYNVVKKYPGTQVAKTCKKRLHNLQQYSEGLIPSEEVF